MPAKITLANPTSSVTSVKLRAGVVVVSPVVSESNQHPIATVSAQLAAAAVTHVYPVSDISYILLASAAYLDTTGLFKYTTDLVTVVENTAFVVSKIADADSFYLNDATTIAFDQATSDSVTMSDNVVTVLIFIRDFAETISLVDSAAKLISPAYVETVSTSDTKVIVVDSGKADSFTLADTTAFQVDTQRTDSFSLADATAFQVDTQRTDSFTLADATAFQVDTQRSDSFSLSDSTTAVYSPAYSDSFSLSDSTTAVYSPAYSDTISLSDAATRSTDKLFSEAMSTSDSGLVVAQNYCDITYFAEDYVGEARTF
jgi:hypothetical protein